jgi:hypothetical protein
MLADRVNESLQHHMGEATSRTKLGKIITDCNDAMLAFLEKPGADHFTFLSTLGAYKLPSNASWYKENLNTMVDMNTISTEIETVLDVNLTDVGKDLTAINKAYLECIKVLFLLDSQLHNKIENIQDLNRRLDEIVDVGDTSVEARALQASIESYIRKSYQENDIEKDYKEFCKMHGRFQILHPIVSSLQIAPGTLKCTICTDEKITTALVPCGHAFCDACASKQRAQCYICRCSVQDRLRLYFV